MDDMSHNDLYFQQIQRINEVKQLIEQNEVSESQIDDLIDTVYTLLNEGDTRDQRLLLFMNDTLFFTIEDYEFLTQDRKTITYKDMRK